MHELCGHEQTGQLTVTEQAAVFGDAGTHAREPFAIQRITATQMVIEKRQRRADRERVQPERELGQFHRHRILVDAVHDTLEDHASHQVPIIEQSDVDRPLAARCLLLDALAQLENFARDRRLIVREAGGVSLGAGVGELFENAVRKVIDEADQKMSAAHCRIADTQSEDRLGRIGFGQDSV